MGWAFASEPCLSCLPLILSTVATHCLYFLILVVFLAVPWFLVVWEGWGGTCDVALLPSPCLYLDEKSCVLIATACVCKAGCSLCVCVLGYWLLCPIVLTIHFLLALTWADTFTQILVFPLQIFLYMKSEWRNGDKICNYGDLFCSFSLLLVYEYLNHRT